MSAIRETLTLEDKFSATFTRYLRMGEKAAGASQIASAALNNYQAVMGSLDKRLILLNSQFSAMTVEQNAMIAAGKQNTEAFSVLDAQMEKLGATIRRTKSQYDAVEKEANEAANATRKFSESNRTATSSTRSLTSALGSLVSIYTVIQGAKWAVGMSDQLASTTARIDRMNDGLQSTQALQDMIYQSAQRSRSLYTETAAFVSKLGTNAGNAFSSSAEIVAFAEQINKQMVLSGTTTNEASAAMLQLTQGLSSGALRGEELNSVLEQTPMIAQTIAKYMGVTTGEMRTLASEGKVTAAVVKNAMFDAAEETNKAFEDMPRTWAQAWNEVQNVAIKELDPLFKAVNDFINSDAFDMALGAITLGLRAAGAAAQFVVDNFDRLAPVVATAAAAFIGYKTAVFVATTAQTALNAAMAANPIGLVIVSVIVLTAVIIKLWDTSKQFREFSINAAEQEADAWISLYNDAIVPAGNGIITLLNQTGNVFLDFAEIVVESSAAASKFFIENFTNISDALTDFVSLYNRIARASGGRFIPILPIEVGGLPKTISDVENLRADAISKITGWRDSLGIDYLKSIDENAFEKWKEGIRGPLENFRYSDYISQVLRDATAGISDGSRSLYEAFAPDQWDLLGDISEGVSSIERAINLAEEDLKSLVDVAERRYVNQVNLTAQTPVITVNGANTGRTAADRYSLANAIRDILIEQAASGSTLSTAVAVSG